MDKQLAPDTIFPSDNTQQIPALLPDLQADLIDQPLLAWGSVKRTSKNPGSWHFYVDDYRFAALWDKAHQIPATKCISVIEVNYSIPENTPYPVALYRIYQKRWLSRYWQSKGIRIVVDINVSLPFLDLNLLGVPDGWRSYATHGYNDRIIELEAEYRAAQKKAGTKNITFLVYGGGQAVKEYCAADPIISHVSEHRDKVKPV